MRATEKKKDRDQRKRQREKRERLVDAQSDYTDLLPLVQSGKHMMSRGSLSPPEN